MGKIALITVILSCVIINDSRAADLPVCTVHCDTTSDPPRNERSLNLNEIAYFATFFGANIDYNKVRIVQRVIPEPFRFAGGYTRGSVIYLSSIRYRNDYTRYAKPKDFWMDDVATVIRELCHVWQSQKKVPGFSDGAIRQEHQTFNLDVYKYELAESKRLTEFRFEQQCQILFDFVYVRAFKDPSFSKYLEVISSDIDLDSILPITSLNARVPELVSIHPQPRRP